MDRLLKQVRGYPDCSHLKRWLRKAREERAACVGEEEGSLAPLGIMKDRCKKAA